MVKLYKAAISAKKNFQKKKQKKNLQKYTSRQNNKSKFENNNSYEIRVHQSFDMIKENPNDNFHLPTRGIFVKTNSRRDSILSTNNIKNRNRDFQINKISKNNNNANINAIESFNKYYNDKLTNVQMDANYMKETLKEIQSKPMKLNSIEFNEWRNQCPPNVKSKIAFKIN